MSLPTLRTMSSPFPASGALSSAALNEKFEIVHDNWTRLLLAMQNVASEVQNLTTAFGVLNDLRNASLGEITHRLATVEANLSSKVFTLSAYETVDTLESSTNIRMDTQYGMITLARTGSYQSKIARYRSQASGQVEVSTLNKLYYGPDSESLVQQPSTSSLYKTLDGRNTTFWMDTNSGGGEMERIIRVEVPTSPIMKANVIELQPFPDVSCDVRAIRIKTPAGTYQDLPLAFGRGFNNAVCLVPEPVEFGNGFEVVIGTNSGNHIGMSHLDIGYTTYAESGSAVWKLTDSNGIASLDKVFLDAAVPTGFGLYTFPYTLEISKNATFTEIIYDSTTMDLPYAGSSISVGDATDIYVRLTLRRIHDTTPVVRGLGIAYTGTV